MDADDRRTYTPPAVEVIGTVEELTAGAPSYSPSGPNDPQYNPGGPS